MRATVQLPSTALSDLVEETQLHESVEGSIPGHMQKRAAVRPLDLHRHKWSLSRVVQCVLHGTVSMVSLELLPENNLRQAVVRAMR